MDATVTQRLSEPSLETAQQFSVQVEYEKRLVGLKMAAMGGSNPTEIYSLAQLANFIHVDDYQTSLNDNHATVGFVDPAAISAWVGGVLGDTELAGAVGEVAAGGGFYGAIAMPIKELLLERVAQCEALLSPAEEPEG